MIVAKLMIVLGVVVAFVAAVIFYFEKTAPKS